MNEMERKRKVAEFYRHHDNAAEYIEATLEELEAARKHYPVMARTEDHLRSALAQVNLRRGS